MEFYFAPLEGVSGAQYRQAHHRWFSGVDKYYMPFISPTQDHVFTARELRNIAPEANAGIPAVPQLLTRRAEDFCWAAGELKAMGYGEVNLNLGCPSGTVVSKGKGAGLLADPEGLDRLLDGIFTGTDMQISVKTRLGIREPEEFSRLLEIFARYPISLLILHPRVREDYYKNPVRVEEFAQALGKYPGQMCYNGGLVTAADCGAFQRRFPGISKVMIGQGLLANPALARQAKGGSGPEREELRGFHDQLYQGYLAAFSSGRNTVFHMKELWSYLCRLFEGGDKLFKQIRKAQDTAAYEAAVERIFRTLPLRQDAMWA
jgi:tRNA-dihydrouridine synthase